MIVNSDEKTRNFWMVNTPDKINISETHARTTPMYFLDSELQCTIN